MNSQNFWYVIFELVKQFYGTYLTGKIRHKQKLHFFQAILFGCSKKKNTLIDQWNKYRMGNYRSGLDVVSVRFLQYFQIIFELFFANRATFCLARIFWSSGLVHILRMLRTTKIAGVYFWSASLASWRRLLAFFSAEFYHFVDCGLLLGDNYGDFAIRAFVTLYMNLRLNLIRHL